MSQIPTGCWGELQTRELSTAHHDRVFLLRSQIRESRVATV